MMWTNNYMYKNDMFMGDIFSGIFTTVLLPFVFWSLFWKGWALWRAAKNDSKSWFIVLLLVNTLGILDILYIFVFGKKTTPKLAKAAKRSSR